MVYNPLGAAPLLSMYMMGRSVAVLPHIVVVVSSGVEPGQACAALSRGDRPPGEELHGSA